MKLPCRVLLTGASGGIGHAIALELARRGCSLTLVGRDEQRLSDTASDCRSAGSPEVFVVPADLSQPGAAADVAQLAEEQMGEVDAVVHSAGVNRFDDLTGHRPADIESIIRVNLTVPALLTHAVLPRMTERGSGAVLFVGSIFGSLGFPCFSVYSASKFGVRGLAESLRRELTGSGVEVLYVGPRGTRTAMTDAYADMAKRTKMNLDDPTTVAKKVVDALAKGRPERLIGFPEALFARLNGIFPRLIDKALAKEAARMRAHITPPAPSSAQTTPTRQPKKEPVA